MPERTNTLYRPFINSNNQSDSLRTKFQSETRHYVGDPDGQTHKENAHYSLPYIGCDSTSLKRGRSRDFAVITEAECFWRIIVVNDNQYLFSFRSFERHVV